MFVTTYQNIDDFLAKTEAVFLQQEVVNNLILGISLNIKRSPERFEKPYLATVEDEQGLAAAAVMTPPNNIILYSNRTERTAALQMLALHMWQHQVPLPGAIGPTEVVEDFCTGWEKLSGQKRLQPTYERLFQLSQVTSPRSVPGYLRPAREDDAEIIAQWIADFYIEALEEPGTLANLAEARARIAGNNLFVWEATDGRIVSLAAKSRPTINVVTIALVYTPPAYRGMGYASNCVAALSQHLLDSGWKYCSLFTDLANPISNSIYQKMGYRAVCDFTEYKFG